MAKYFIQDTTLTNIADAIREKTGSTNILFPSNMPNYIRSIKTVSSDTNDIPNDIITEANRVINNMIPKIGNNSLTFIAMSDTHEKGISDDSSASNIERISRGNKNAGQAAKLISDKIPLDFFAHLGDFSWGGSATTIEDGVSSICRVKEYIADVANDNESFFTLGNHDNLRASYSVNGEYLSHGVLSGLIGDYRYKDFENKKVRVICLNTADNSYDISYGERVSGEQLQWFAQALDLSSKNNASEWGIVILSHHPLDWCYIKPAANILAAYLDGANYSATHDGVAVSYNFKGKNAAKIIAQFHGHVHGFKVDYINDFRTGTAIPTTVNRLGIPNACYDRTNEYGENGKTEWDGIEFGEESSYEKVDNSTGKNTAFCLVSINLDENVIYADCFGAGYDRIVSYADKEIATHTITNNLSYVYNNNGIASVIDNSNYSATLTANDGYELSVITVTMGGIDITSTAVNGNNINIPNVTGNVVITAIATYVDNFEYGEFTNLVPTATATHDGTEIYNAPKGYQDGYYVSSGGEYKPNQDMVAVGYIPFTSGDVIYVKCPNADITTNSYVRFYTHTTSGSAFNYSGTLASVDEDVFNWNSSAGNHMLTVTRLADRYYKLETTNIFNASITYYYRISLQGSGDGLIITHNEPIHKVDDGEQTSTYTITNNLTNVISSNSATSVKEETSYSATLSANSRYEINSVTITMGGTDITPSAYANGTINIPNVTGNIIITASATLIETEEPSDDYTNLVTTSIGTDGNIFNAGVTDGYMNGTYASGTHYGTDPACVTTGYIEFSNGTKCIYIRGAEWQNISHCRIRFFNESSLGTASASYSISGDKNDGGVGDMSRYFTMDTLGDKYYKLTLVSDMGSYLYGKYYCMSLVGTGENLIITHDQPIE